MPEGKVSWLWSYVCLLVGFAKSGANWTLRASPVLGAGASTRRCAKIYEDIRRYVYQFINGMWHKDSARICALVSWTWTEDQIVHFPDPGVPRAVQIDDPAQALEALMAVSGGKF